MWSDVYEHYRKSLSYGILALEEIHPWNIFPTDKEAKEAKLNID